MRTNRGVKIILSMILTLSLIFSILGYAKAQPQKLPYKIGVNGSLTGVYAAVSGPFTEGIKIRVNAINRQGGINGHPLELTIVDDGGDPNKAVLATKNMIAVGNIHVLNPGVMTAITQAIIPIVTDEKCPAVGGAGSGVVDRPPKHWYFRPAMNDLEQLLYAVGIFNKLGVKKTAIIYSSSAFGKGMMVIAPLWLKDSGYQITGVESYNPTDTDMTPQLSKIAMSNPDALTILGSELGGGLVVKQAREMGLKYPMWLTNALFNPDIVKVVRQYYDMESGTYTAMDRPVVSDLLPADSPDAAAGKEFVSLYNQSDYGKKQGSPIPSTLVGGYRSMQVLEDALKRSKADPDPTKLTETRAAIRGALEQTKDLVVSGGKFTMSPNDHCGSRPGTVLAPVAFKNGNFVVMVDVAAKMYDSPPPKWWYPSEWETPTKPKEPGVR